MDLNVCDVLEELNRLSNSNTKKIYKNHGIKNFIGVKIGDFKKLVKFIKKDQKLVLDLFNTGIYECFYLAGLSIDIKKIDRKVLELWVDKIDDMDHIICEYVVAKVIAESSFAHDFAIMLINSDNEMRKSCGYSIYTNYISIQNDDILLIDEIRSLLIFIRDNIKFEKDRVKYTMNGFVIGVGAYVKDLSKLALDIANSIGNVSIDFGNTSCKVPNAVYEIEKLINMGRIGYKRKKCRC